MFIPINDISKYGIIKDTEPHKLPLGAWSNGQNVRFVDNKVQKFLGDSQVLGTPSVTPYWGIYAPTSTTLYWFYFSLAKAYITDGTTHTNVTRQAGGGGDDDYSASADILWNGVILGGVPMINNGIDDPQMMSSVSPSNDFESLTFDASNTWADNSYTTQWLSSFKNYGIALHFNDGSTDYPHMVLWSDPADPGAVPSSWDWTDTTVLAGRAELKDSPGSCMSSFPLRDQNVIFKEDQAWAMFEVGGNAVFRFQKLFDDGVFTRRCAAYFRGNQLVLTNNDLIVHSGGNPESIVTKRQRSALFNAIDEDNLERSFVVPNYPQNEIWVCYPTIGSSYPDRALVWNYEDNTFGERDLGDGVAHISIGVVDTGADNTWNADTDTWDSDTTSWDKRNYNPAERKLLLFDQNNTKLKLADDTNQFDGTIFISYVERTGIDFDLPSKVKAVTEIWPYIDGDSGGVVKVRVGSQSTPNSSVDWEPTQNFTIGTTEHLTFRSRGKYIAVRLASDTDISWECTGFELKVTQLGRF